MIPGADASFLVEGGDGVGVLVLSGSSGRVESERCRVLAAAGATAMSVRWFGGPGQSASVDRVPLELFDEPLALLYGRCERLVVLGSSRGAEVGLLLGAIHPEAAALLPVERIKGEVLLVAGEDDRVWPSADFADAIAARREVAGLPTTVVRHPEAGHRVVLPGESPAEGGRRMARGGSNAADAELGRLAWPRILDVLGQA